MVDTPGNILGYRCHAVYDLGLLQQVSKNVMSAVDSVKLIQPEWDAITAQYAEGKLLIRNLSDKSAGRGATLTVIADSRLNVSFAGVAVRVAVSKLKSILDGSAGAAPFSAAQASAIHAPVSLGSSSLSASQGLPKGVGAEVASSGLSWSGLAGSSSMSTSGVSVTDAASSEFLTACTKALAKSVGPMAKIYVKDAVRKLCADRPFSKDFAVELVAELANHINKPNEATQFRQLLQKNI